MKQSEIALEAARVKQKVATLSAWLSELLDEAHGHQRDYLEAARDALDRAACALAKAAVLRGPGRLPRSP